MASVKKLNTSYTIDTADVYLTGNLHVTGAYDTTNVTDTNILDKNIYLNSGETGAGVGGTGISGIVIERGSLANVALRWEETTDRWQITLDGSVYSNIATTTSATSTTALTTVVEDTAPVLGGNINVNGKTIYANVAATSYIILQGGLQMKYANVTYTAATGSIVFNAANEGAGQTGLYVTGVASTNQELITKRRAFGFSLLLG